jgi:1-acyl-sn-glycerol-3-phosphate acyltransferase
MAILPAMLRGLFVHAVLVVVTLVLSTAAIAGEALVRSGRVAHRCARLWARIILFVSGVRVETRNLERLDREGAAVLVANHASHFDIYAVAALLPRPALFVAKASLFRIPVFGWALRSAGFVSVERDRREKAIASLGRASEGLGRGRPVIFFPEGTRSPDGRLRRLKKGAFVTAIQNGVPLVPIGIAGSHRVQPARSLRVRPGTIRLLVGEEISTEGLTLADRDALAARGRQALAALLPEDQRPARTGRKPS